MKHIEITIPVLNEEQTLDRQVNKVIDYISSLEKPEYSISIVISDNGSTDGTESIGKSLQEKYKGRVKYLNVGERGVGRALKRSWSNSKADIVGYMDLDLATDLKHFEQVIEAFDTQLCDIVYGSRLHRDSIVVGRTFKREVTSRIFNKIVSKYLGTNFSDGMCGFKFLKKSLVDELMQYGAVSDGWFFCTELLVVAEWRGKKLYELPVHWTDDPNSKVDIKKLAQEYLQAMKALKNFIG